MTPHGTDRVRLDGERVLLSSRLPKGWTARVARTATSAEFPGTAVLWEEEIFEVIAVEAVPGGVRYTLEPWRDHHSMRLTDRYDAEREAHRDAEHRAAVVRERKRAGAGALALLTGHLPAIVQERLGSELGLIPARLTMISFVSSWLAIAGLATYVVVEVMKKNPVPFWPAIVALFLLVETGFRFLIVWTQNRPAGSTVGVVAYLFYWLATGRSQQASPFAAPRGSATPISNAPDEVALRDALTLSEPLATLLPERDQRRLHERFGYDYRRLAPKVAGVLLALALVGAITSGANRQFVTLLVAIGVAVEQVLRLKALRRGPAPSVFGWVVRPILRKLL